MKTLAVAIAGLFAVTLAFTITHEEVHKEVFSSFGVDSEIVLFPSGLAMDSVGFATLAVTVPNQTQWSRLSVAEQREVRLVNSFNEAYGYPMLFLVQGVYVLILVAFFAMRLVKKVGVQNNEKH